MRSFVIIALLLAAFAQEGLITINPKTRMLTDAHGRSVVLHGVSAVYKVDPYIPLNETWDS